ncbi:MAG TPA: alcohol dehydrogenase catalytic domain-containing protein [Candidatus Binataceae bacterium]|nr:alcohol dehydrogenase catalytic domain-containing protein [Candidatus Binataceae bacterium]
MRAIVIDNGVSLRRDYPEPEPKPGESIVRVRLAGICGTDLELAKGYMNFRGVPGHEFVGEVVEATNSSMRRRRVVGEINAGCGACRNCAEGLARHCPNRTVLGILGRDGAFAEYLRLPDRNLIALPDSISDEMAVFVEPLAAAYEIFEQIRIPHNHRVLVLGDGRLGILVTMAMRAEGYDVDVAGHHPERAQPLGIDVQREQELNDRYDVVVDCTGSSGGFSRALEIVRPRGTVILKSTAAASADLNLAPVVINEITVLGSRCGAFAPAIDALASDKIDPRPLISATLSLDDGAHAFDEAAKSSNFKILIKVS